MKSVETGIYINGGNALIEGCQIQYCSYGIWGQDALCVIEKNLIPNSGNNGILVWTSTIAGNNSIVAYNRIFTVSSGSGAGQNGNGISVYQAVAVTVIGNQISGCQYTAVRVNGGGDAIILGNNIYGSRENGVFIEAPASGINFTNGAVVGNLVDSSGGGISVANSGSGGQGTAEAVTITGNHICGITRNTINDPGYIPTVGIGFGISVETTCVVSGNTINSAAGIGINAGHNGAAGDVNVAGNFVLSAPIGIGYPSGASYGQIVTSDNQVKGASAQAIIAVQYNDTTDTLSVVPGATNFGNQYDAQEVNTFVGNNRSY